jgi:hypothetical protein
MSSQTIADAFAPAIARYKAQVIESTWGHLAPKKNKSYSGWIVFSIAADGLYCLIDYDFKKLDGSPWFYDALQDFIGDNAKERGKVYRFDGTFCNYVFEGTIRQLPTA